MNDRLIKPATEVVSADDYEHQRRVGYVEFYGEAVLDRMTHAIMADLLGTAAANKPYQDTLYPQHGNTGTNAWLWSDAPAFDACVTAPSGSAAGRDTGGSRCDMGLSDVGNWLSGSAFLLIPGKTSGVAYNAEAFVNFRTAGNDHRIENYHVGTEGNAVILHDQSGEHGAGLSPVGDYVYHFAPEGDEDRFDESRISFNNTWGPTLSDGDDYSLFDLRDTDITGENDDWDARLGVPNSIAEVEEAIRMDGQTFTSYYFDGASLSGGALKSWFFFHFPTKFYYGEDDGYWNQKTLDGYIREAVKVMMRTAKPLNIEIWDINEVPGGQSVGGCISPDPCAIVTAASLGHELSFFGVDYFKRVFNTGTAASFKNGRVVVSAKANNPRRSEVGSVAGLAYPMMGYTFESGGADVIGQWRSMQR
jgi:hypothetical protein